MNNAEPLGELAILYAKVVPLIVKSTASFTYIPTPGPVVFVFSLLVNVELIILVVDTVLPKYKGAVVPVLLSKVTLIKLEELTGTLKLITP